MMGKLTTRVNRTNRQFKPQTFQSKRRVHSRNLYDKHNYDRGEIGTCPNTEVEIDVKDKSPFFIRPYHVKEEDKNFIHKEIKCLCYLGILKEGFSAYSSPVMLISRKVTKDKRVVTDFRHLNIRIAKII